MPKISGVGLDRSRRQAFLYGEACQERVAGLFERSHGDNLGTSHGRCLPEILAPLREVLHEDDPSACFL